MDVEDFTREELDDELLKIVDELFSRGDTEEAIINRIRIGTRL